MNTTYLVENSHDAADADDAFDSRERVVATSGASVRDHTPLGTCPDGAHGGTAVVEAETPGEAESLGGRWAVGETTVNQRPEMEVG